MLQAMNVGLVLTDAFILSLSIINVLSSILLLRILPAELYYFTLWIWMHVVTFFMFLIQYNIQYYFMKVFLKASIVCIFYEHFVILVCTLTRFIRGNEIKTENVLCVMFFSLILHRPGGKLVPKFGLHRKQSIYSCPNMFSTKMVLV